MPKIKRTKGQQILDLERKLLEALAGQAHVYYFADKALEKISKDHCTGSGIIMTLSFLGGKEVCEPILIRDGLSDETIANLRADISRSYELTTLFKPGA